MEAIHFSPDVNAERLSSIYNKYRQIDYLILRDYSINHLTIRRNCCSPFSSNTINFSDVL